MGSIVSSKKQALGQQSEIYPTEGYAQEAKHRQAALQAGLHLPLVRKLSRKDAFDLGSASDEDDIREWYPAGVSPWFYNEDTGVLQVTAEGAGHWMDDVSISAMELHRAAVIIQRVIRGYQTRKSLIREHEGAMKIQRTYRSYKRRQSAQLLNAGMAPSYLKTFTISDSVAKDNRISSENCIIWQDPSTKPEHGESRKQRGVCRSQGASNKFTTGSTSGVGSDGKGTYSYLKIVEGIEPKEILEAVKVPIRSNAQLLQSSSHHGENSEISRQDLAAAAKLVTARKEEIAMSEKKDTSFRSSIPQREVAAARQTLSPSTLGQSVVATSMRTWTPETSYSNPISPDSGLGRLTESRESEKSAFSSLPSVRGYGPSNGPMGSLPSLKDSLSSMRGSLPSLKESNPSLRTSPTTSKNSSRELHPDLREMAVITNYENHSEHYVFTTNDASGRGLQNGQEINSRKIVQGLTETNRTPMPFRLTRPWPLAFQVKPDSNDAQEIAKALENEERGNHLGTGRQQEALGDPLMHPVTYASNSLKATVRKAGRGSTPNRAAELMKEAMMRKNEETVISTGDPLSTVKGMNYQRLMNEMREQRRIEMQRREAEREAARNRAKEESSAASALSSSNKESLKSESRSSVTPRTRLQIKNRTSTSTRDSTSIATTSNSKKVVKEDENITSFIPQLSIITEDETCDEEKSTFSLKDWDVCPVPIRSSNTLTVPNNNHHLLKMDPLIKMLYQEISEGNDDTSDRDQSRGDPKAVRGGQEGGEGNEGEEKGNGGGEENGEIELTPELIERVRTAIIKRQLSKKGTRPMLGGRSNSKEAESPVEIYGKDSILIAPPDVETLLKAAEFRGGVVKKLKHLTTAIRLDYHEFINSVEQTLFYAAQQAEASLHNYHPPTILLISSSVPKCKILRNAAKPGVLAHIYDFSSSLNDLLNDIAQLLENFRPGAKAKNLGIVCKGGPGYFYLMKKIPVTPAKLRNRDEILQFWQGLGHHMSKLYPGQSVIHMMESNVAGNRQGENLLSDLEAALYSHQVKVVSPLEMAPSGREMLNTYFDPGKHKLWKMMRYTKLRLYK